MGNGFIKKIDNIYSNTDGLIIAPSDGNSTNNEHTINIIIAWNKQTAPWTKNLDVNSSNALNPLFKSIFILSLSLHISKTELNNPIHIATHTIANNLDLVSL